MTQITAIGHNVILVSNPPKAGDEQVSEGGLILPALEQSGLPEYCTVHSIGSEVPKGVLEIGDKTAVPMGQMKNVPHPDVISGKVKSADCREAFVTCDWRAIPAIYR